MGIVWRSNGLTVSDVVDQLKETTDSAYTTIMTIMTRLTEKGLLEREVRGRAYVYRAAMTEVQYREALSRGRVRDLIAEFGDVAIAQFAEELRDVDPERARRLAALLRKQARE